MLSTVTRRIVARTQVRGFAAASPWGTDAWRHDKDAFKAWTTAAVNDPTGSEARQMYGFLGIAFGDVDADKDGLINVREFDHLCEKVAALPRRYGMAPSWQKEYGNSLEGRTAARKTMFNTITGYQERMSLDQWCTFANTHVNAKVATIDHKRCDFNHLEKSNVAQFLQYITLAMEDPQSGAYASFFEFVLCLFVEADGACRGKITFDQFDILADKAAAVPRFYGLAPEGKCSVTRKEIFDNMSCHEGYITFDDFLAWTIKHTKAHLKDPTAKATV